MPVDDQNCHEFDYIGASERNTGVGEFRFRPAQRYTNHATDEYKYNMPAGRVQFDGSMLPSGRAFLDSVVDTAVNMRLHTTRSGGYNVLQFLLQGSVIPEFPNHSRTTWRLADNFPTGSAGHRITSEVPIR